MEQEENAVHSARVDHDLRPFGAGAGVGIGETPTESDVLFTPSDQLPTFSGVLSTGEIMQMTYLSYLSYLSHVYYYPLI